MQRVTSLTAGPSSPKRNATVNATTRVLCAALVAAAFAVGAWDNLYPRGPPLHHRRRHRAVRAGRQRVGKIRDPADRKAAERRGCRFFHAHHDPRQCRRGHRRTHSNHLLQHRTSADQGHVPVNVDAAIFWHVHDAQKATLAITDYRQAIERVAQASVRKMIGASMSASLLSDRKTVGMHLRDKIGRMIADWSVPVQPGHVVRMTSTADLSGSRKLP
ncbi:hypothetical protein ACVK00_000317 [Burkholderia sp. PvR073]